MKKSKLEFNSLLKPALNIVEAAGKGALRSQKRVSIRYKGRIDPVTSSDTETEKYLVKMLSLIGDFGFLCEEDTHRSIRDIMWVIDPIDGTVNYAHGNHVWAISISLLVKGLPVLGF